MFAVFTGCQSRGTQMQKPFKCKLLSIHSGLGMNIVSSLELLVRTVKYTVHKKVHGWYSDLLFQDSPFP